MSAEEIRDNALAVSGLLVNKVGGPSVYPYQSEGIWVPGVTFIPIRSRILFRTKNNIAEVSTRS
jgi:hypothetical protein